MLNSVGARTHPWFTPLRISNGSDVTPSYTTVLSMLLWKEEITLSSSGGQPIFSSRLNNPRLLTRSNAFVRSIKAIHSGLLCSGHLSCNYCGTDNIMSIVDLPVLKPH